ncbi:HAD family hydrolase [Sphingomonas oryzagri]|uniref:HAD family phosphatase n=1 Tax=Sphingomonas oryzagri TaxID=3042314 RepID=A0ABT6N7I0_9SPHN|nr:HAD family phosphatase [Sphingomonas oryzagri]MDH7641069.1 HAD family phosphatase [Sphingomonas oryzagri]
MATAPVVASPRSVVFDVGNVLVDWNPRALFARHVTDSARLDRLMGEVLTLEWHTQHDAGRDFADTSAERIALYPDEAENIRRWGAQFDATIGDLLPGMADLVADLDAAGVPLYAITNFSHEFWPPFRAREAALFDRFRDIVVSGEVKLIKPDPAIYALALGRFGLAPGEALFVDDRQDNVEAGERAGFVGHRFADAATLRAALEGLGLL